MLVCGSYLELATKWRQNFVHSDGDEHYFHLKMLLRSVPHCASWLIYLLESRSATKAVQVAKWTSLASQIRFPTMVRNMK